MPIPDAELPPIVENGDGLFSDLESDLARELRAAREMIVTLWNRFGGDIHDDDLWDKVLALLPEEPSDG